MKKISRIIIFLLLIAINVFLYCNAKLAYLPERAILNMVTAEDIILTLYEITTPEEISEMIRKKDDISDIKYKFDMRGYKLSYNLDANSFFVLHSQAQMIFSMDGYNNHSFVINQPIGRRLATSILGAYITSMISLGLICVMLWSYRNTPLLAYFFIIVMACLWMRIYSAPLNDKMPSIKMGHSNYIDCLQNQKKQLLFCLPPNQDKFIKIDNFCYLYFTKSTQDILQKHNQYAQWINLDSGLWLCYYGDYVNFIKKISIFQTLAYILFLGILFLATSRLLYFYIFGHSILRQSK